MKVLGERIFMPVNNCMVIELEVFLTDVVPTVYNHKQAVEVKRCGIRTLCLQTSHHSITVIIIYYENNNNNNNDNAVLVGY